MTITLGFILQFVAPHPKLRDMGTALLGFGLIFLGMNTMGDGITPHRDMFAAFLKGIHGDTLPGLIRGVLVATLVTGIIQSSGAVIGMCFALIHAGVFTSLDQVFPIVLGAHIGTCATALLGSIGTNIEARRSAFSHLIFNIITVSLSVALAPVFLKLIPMTSADLLRQTANAHTAVMLFGSILILPVAPLYAKFVSLVIPTRKPLPQRSFLDSSLIEYPEKAIYAAIAELQRVTKICARSFRLAIDILFQVKRKEVQEVKLNENVVDEIKKAMKDYLGKLTRRHLSRRQAIMIQHLNRCMADIERIGDHIDEVCDISIRRMKNPQARFNRETLELLFSLYEAADRVLHLVIQSLNPDNQDFQGMAQSILLARDEYIEKSINAKSAFTERIANHEFPPIVGMFFSEYSSAFDRIVKHAKIIALAEKQPYFWIKRKKLNRMEDEAPAYKPPPLTDAHDFLDRLHSEEYL
jgi:phosphate:Na+ symporter